MCFEVYIDAENWLLYPLTEPDQSGQTEGQTDRQADYGNPCCACAPRVNNELQY